MENKQANNNARRPKLNTKHKAIEQLKSILEKLLHGKYPKRVNDKDMDQAQTSHWPRKVGQKSEIEGFIIAALDQCIKTNYYRNKTLKDSLYRVNNKQQDNRLSSLWILRTGKNKKLKKKKHNKKQKQKKKQKTTKQ